MGHLTNNVLIVLQGERGVSLQEAADLVGAHWSGLVETFEKAKAELPSFGEGLDPLIAYVMEFPGLREITQTVASMTENISPRWRLGSQGTWTGALEHRDTLGRTTNVCGKHWLSTCRLP